MPVYMLAHTTKHLAKLLKHSPRRNHFGKEKDTLSRTIAAVGGLNSKRCARRRRRRRRCEKSDHCPGRSKERSCLSAYGSGFGVGRFFKFRQCFVFHPCFECFAVVFRFAGQPRCVHVGRKARVALDCDALLQSHRGLPSVLPCLQWLEHTCLCLTSGP